MTCAPLIPGFHACLSCRQRLPGTRRKSCGAQFGQRPWRRMRNGMTAEDPSLCVNEEKFFGHLKLLLTSCSNSTLKSLSVMNWLKSAAAARWAWLRELEPTERPWLCWRTRSLVPGGIIWFRVVVLLWEFGPIRGGLRWFAVAVSFRRRFRRGRAVMWGCVLSFVCISAMI